MRLTWTDRTGSHALTLRTDSPVSGSCAVPAFSTEVGTYSFAPTMAKAWRVRLSPTVPPLPFGAVVPGQSVNAAEFAGRESTFWYCEVGPKIGGRMFRTSAP